MKRPKSRIVEYASSLDWLTYTSFSDDSRANDFRSIWREVKRELFLETKEATEIRVRDYHGQKIQGISFLERPSDRHLMMVASGDNTSHLANIIRYADLCGKEVNINSTCSKREYWGVEEVDCPKKPRMVPIPPIR